MLFRSRVVEHKKTKKLYALKYIDKAKCIKQKSVANIIQERRLLEEVCSIVPFPSPTSSPPPPPFPRDGRYSQAPAVLPSGRQLCRLSAVRCGAHTPTIPEQSAVWRSTISFQLLAYTSEACHPQPHEGTRSATQYS